MAVLTIKKFPDEPLKQKAQPVAGVTDDERKLIRDMFETMYFSNGVGLAAPQIGVSKRIIVCNPTGQKPDEIAVINPVIIYRKGKKAWDCEGCLSMPYVTAEVARFPVVGVEGLDFNGNKLTLEAKDLLARIISHEYDHLDGILFIDRIGFWKKKSLLRQYRKKTGVQCAGKQY